MTEHLALKSGTFSIIFDHSGSRWFPLPLAAGGGGVGGVVQKLRDWRPRSVAIEIQGTCSIVMAIGDDAGVVGWVMDFAPGGEEISHRGIGRATDADGSDGIDELNFFSRSANLASLPAIEIVGG
jgi:hypothetical protein